MDFLLLFFLLPVPVLRRRAVKSSFRNTCTSSLKFPLSLHDPRKSAGPLYRASRHWASSQLATPVPPVLRIFCGRTLFSFREDFVALLQRGQSPKPSTSFRLSNIETLTLSTLFRNPFDLDHLSSYSERIPLTRLFLVTRICSRSAFSGTSYEASSPFFFFPSSQRH